MKVALLDREGTIIVDPSYDRVDAPDKVKLLPHTIEALSYLAEHEFGIVIITNQTNIAQGRITEQSFWELHNHILKLIESSGVQVLKTYVCPHNADENCACRKPKPALLLEAMEDFKLSPAGTFMIGDRDTDVLAGQNAGTKTILVRTGKHPTTVTDATYTADNLLEAARYIVTNSSAKA